MRLFKHPVQHLDQRCCLRRYLHAGRITWRMLYDKARSVHESGQESDLLGYLRWCFMAGIVGPSVGADEETIKAFRWIEHTMPWCEREGDCRGDGDFDGVDSFWDEAAHVGMNPFWGS